MSNTRRKPIQEAPKRRGRPATTPDERENELIILAMDLAEKQLREGTASAQVTTHYLKLASSRERLEQQRLQHETSLVQAKVEDLEANKRIEELYEEAIHAMRGYQGQEVEEYYDEN